jgi:hypothetical protein
MNKRKRKPSRPVSQPSKRDLASQIAAWAAAAHQVWTLVVDVLHEISKK